MTESEFNEYAEKVFAVSPSCDSPILWFGSREGLDDFMETCERMYKEEKE